jgi:hypothetical protein
LTIASPQTNAIVLVASPDVPAIGFFGASPATQAPALIPLVDNSTGTPSNTVVDAGPQYSQGAIDGNFASLTVKVNALITAMKRHGLMST